MAQDKNGFIFEAGNGEDFWNVTGLVIYENLG